ncbi:TadE family protein [Cellulomonas hominis]|uniref:TadE family protein n=1 Tax=Cellulomonas hominis TaxID=156981 RepID=A0A7Z8JWR1_9CELL|nr:TadE family protein [Cellulomonas hominis]
MTGRPRRGPQRDRGSVTAEFAVLLPVVAVLIGVVVALAASAVTQLRCADAARVAARVAAIGEGDAAVAAAAARVAGAGARTAVARDAAWVVVTVEASVGPAVPLVGGITVRGTAAAWVEP